MTIDMRPKVSEQYREGLMNEYESLIKKSKDYLLIASSLQMQVKARMNALADRTNFRTDEEYIKCYDSALVLSSKTDAYTTLCHETIARINDIKSKLGL